jgi:hypothetical protein
MTQRLLPPFPATRRSVRREAGESQHAERVHARRERIGRHERQVLGRYIDRGGRPREVVARQAAGASVVVVDRDVATLGDRRLVAHLGADEPAENAALVCRLYLEDARGCPCRCRRMTAEDLLTVPFSEEGEAQAQAQAGRAVDDSELLDRCGRSYRLELLRTGTSIPQLRWRVHPAPRTDDEPHLVSVREAIACLESYEPVRGLTAGALALHGGADGVSTVMLRGELQRVKESPIVLNRRLREAVLATIERQGLSMSEIAIRCGRVKRDFRGNESGETSWLARRIGILPEAGRSMPTPWVHSDVLALIARRGLGLSPLEVEMG